MKIPAWLLPLGLGAAALYFLKSGSGGSPSPSATTPAPSAFVPYSEYTGTTTAVDSTPEVMKQASGGAVFPTLGTQSFTEEKTAQINAFAKFLGGSNYVGTATASDKVITAPATLTVNTNASTGATSYTASATGAVNVGGSNVILSAPAGTPGASVSSTYGVVTSSGSAPQAVAVSGYWAPGVTIAKANGSVIKF